MDTETKHFEETFQRTSRIVYTIAYRLTGTEEDARDLTQETYIKAWNKWDQCRNKKNPLPWLRRICTNLFIDKKRTKKDVISIEELEKEGASITLASDIPTPSDELLADNAIREVKAHCLTSISTRLPLFQRIVFVLHDVFDINIDEIADLLDRSVSATKALLHRGRENMNAFFGTRCSLIIPENICKCKAWLTFREKDEQLKEKARPDFAQVHDFSDPLYKTRSKPETMTKVLSFFKNMPTLNPSDNWLDEMAQILHTRTC
jgi:RNA polymerase sigma-70 factor (ECF subfamily)